MNVNKNFKQFITKLLNLKNDNVFNKPNPNKLNPGGKYVRKDNIQHGSNEESKEEEFDLGQYNKHIMNAIYKKNKEVKLKLMDEIAEFYKRRTILRRKVFKVMEYLADDKIKHFQLRYYKLTDDKNNNMLKQLASLQKVVEQHRFKHFMDLKKELDRYNNIIENAIMLQPHPAIFFICDMLRFVIENNRIFNSNLLKWALSQLLPEDFKSQFAKMLKMIMDTYEINF